VLRREVSSPPAASKEKGTYDPNVLETALAQLRFAYSLTLGPPFHTPSLVRLIDAIRETQHEFGPMAIGAEGTEILGGPALDESTRRDMQMRRFRGQAKRGARETSYYQRLFAELDLEPGRLRAEDIASLPLTPKRR
jgi:phenylacetate-CoA ligase